MRVRAYACAWVASMGTDIIVVLIESLKIQFWYLPKDSSEIFLVKSVDAAPEDTHVQMQT